MVFRAEYICGVGWAGMEYKGIINVFLTRRHLSLSLYHKPSRRNGIIRVSAHFGKNDLKLNIALIFERDFLMPV